MILAGYFLVELLLWGIGSARLGSQLVESNKSRIILLLVAQAGVALYTASRVTTKRAREILLLCLLIGLTMNSAIGVIQIVGGHDLRYILKLPGFVLNEAVTATGGTLTADMSERFGVPRAVGSSGHAIEYSVLSAVTIPLALHFVRFAATRWGRLLAGAATAIAMGGVIVGVSRSGLVALAAALLLYVWTFNVRQLAKGAVAAALALGAVSVVLSDSAQALLKTVTNSSEDDSVLVRIAAFAKVSEIFRQYPVFGLGPGATNNLETGHFDNEWLQVIAQGGIVGTVNMIALCAGAIFGIAAALRSADDKQARDQAFTMGAMLLAILSSTSTYDMFAYQQVTFIFFMLIALMWATFRVEVPEPKNHSPGLKAGPRPEYAAN
jgi:hypothetical protein